MPLNLQEFLKEEFQGYVQNVPPQREYLLKSLLPNEPVYDIDFAYNVVNGEYAQAASITGFSATAPLRDKKQLSQAFGSVTKVQHAFRLDEREILKFNAPRHEAEKQQVIDYIYNNTDDLILGVDDLEEFMRAQVLYTGRLKYDDDENDIHIDVDFGIPAENKVSSTTPWSDSASTPLDDIAAAVQAYKASNQRKKPVVMHMTSATEAWLLRNEQIKAQVFGDPTDKRILTVNDVKNVFSALSLPPYQINDDVVNLYGEGEAPLLEDGKVVLLGDALGKTYVGPTAENNFQPGKFVAPKVEMDPPQQSVRVGETVFPALQKPQAIVIMDV
ncbi:major capsid protein [Priestia flexa]|uniref:major capsid protein n=1 Tax=Priestia flexa TaxID=86664 RepID=UPI000473A44C|nr:major capsid protein [Priestia flexa]